MRGVIEKEDAEIGVFISMQEPTKPMRKEAASSGFYQSPWGTQHSRLQLLTIENLFAGKQIDKPYAEGVNVAFKKVPKAKGKRQKQQEFEYTEEN